MGSGRVEYDVSNNIRHTGIYMNIRRMFCVNKLLKNDCLNVLLIIIIVLITYNIIYKYIIYAERHTTRQQNRIHSGADYSHTI